MKEKLKFGYVEPEDCIETNLPSTKNYDYNFDEDEDEDEDEFQDELIEIPLYDFELSKEDNLKTGMKYIIIPINRDGFGGVVNEQLLSEYSQIVTKQEDLFQCDSAGHNLIVVDYATMFGLRLNRFKNYNSDFFLCDERVFFEFLVMKFKYFEFKKFFLSYATIFSEMGIKKDRAVSIIKKFNELGFLKTEVVTDIINGRPSQVTFYDLDTSVIIDLIPNIYLDEETEWDIKHDIVKYLKSGIKKNKKPDIFKNREDQIL